jgi:hypothetical protein
MFIGHFAVGFAAKKIVPKVSLGYLFFACQLLDLIWPALVLMGIETVSVDPSATAQTPLDFSYFPYSHSLLMALVWSALTAALYFFFKRSRRESVVLGLVVFSHWILDWITHRPDLPLTLSDSVKVGLGLWNHVGISLTVELSLFFAGVWVYLKSTERKWSWRLGTLVAFLLVVHLLNVFGPVPQIGTSSSMIAGPALSMWLLVAWGAWADKAKS